MVFQASERVSMGTQVLMVMVGDDGGEKNIWEGIESGRQKIPLFLESCFLGIRSPCPPIPYPMPCPELAKPDSSPQSPWGRTAGRSQVQPGKRKGKGEGKGDGKGKGLASKVS